jgi:hypothetical protein
MSKSQLNTFLGVKSFDTLNTDTVLGGASVKHHKDKKKDRGKKKQTIQQS